MARAGDRQGVPGGAEEMKRAAVAFAALFAGTLLSAAAPPAPDAALRVTQDAASESDGAAIFARDCATCHDGAAGSRAPSPEILKRRSPEAILSALTAGGMRPQGGRLSGAERRAVAEYLSGRALGSDITGARIGRCSSSSPLTDPSSSPAWNGWSPSVTNTRFQTAQQAGLDGRPGAEALAEVGVRISRCDVRMVAADRGERPPVRRQPERDRLLARREERLHPLDVHREERRAHGAGLRSPRRTATRCTSATPAPTSTRSTRRPGRELWSRQARRASVRADHRLADALSGSPVRAGLRRWRRPRPASRATSAARSAAA